MGRRRARKAERRLQRRAGGWWEDGTGREAGSFPGREPGDRALDEPADGGPGAPWPTDPWEDRDLWLSFGEPHRSGLARTCGGCREFVEDGELGRGTCLHPGSGVLHPWTDTAGCDFWSRGGRR